MPSADELLASILRSQNADGGWPFQQRNLPARSPGNSPGNSWTEPTALALLALQSANHSGEARLRAAAWLANHQSPDGGWPPCAIVPQSSWVSSLALLSLAQELALASGCPKGVQWLSRQVYPELPPIQSFVERSLGISPSQAPGSSAWFPGTAGWVIPTALSVLALSCWASRLPDRQLTNTISRAQTYLLSRRCPDSGWNHGGSLQRSEASASYPETTGLALLALATNPSPTLAPALLLAETFLRQPTSPEASAWLLMGLAAHGRNVEEAPPPRHPKTNRDTALQLIAFHALRGHNPFLQAP
jgi:hypothetical protein